MKPVIPEVRDGMPAEVATALLAEPRARLSAAMRKTCQRAREQVFVSCAPIERRWDGEEDKEVWLWSDRKPIEQAVKTQRRFVRASLAQLGKWLRRAVARRFVIQRQYLAVEGETQLAERKRQAYAAIAARLDIIRDACENEIERRKVQADIVAVRNCWTNSSAVSFYRKTDFGPSGE